MGSIPVGGLEKFFFRVIRLENASSLFSPIKVLKEGGLAVLSRNVLFNLILRGTGVRGVGGGGGGEDLTLSWLLSLNKGSWLN